MSKLMIAAVATSAIVVPTAVSANENVAANGVYLSKAGEPNLYFTLNEWADFVQNTTEFTQLVSKYGVSNINVVFSNKVASITQLGAADGQFDEASKNNESATETLTGTYTKTDGTTIPVGDQTPEENSNETFFYNLAI